MQIIKKNDSVVLRIQHTDPQSGERYVIDHYYTLKEYAELKELVRNDPDV